MLSARAGNRNRRFRGSGQSRCYVWSHVNWTRTEIIIASLLLFTCGVCTHTRCYVFVRGPTQRFKHLLLYFKWRLRLYLAHSEIFESFVRRRSQEGRLWQILVETLAAVYFKVSTRRHGKLLLWVTFNDDDGSSWSAFVLPPFASRATPLSDRYLLGEGRHSLGLGRTIILLARVNWVGFLLLSRSLPLVPIIKASRALEVRLFRNYWLVVVIVFLRDILCMVTLMWILFCNQHRTHVREVGSSAPLDITKLHLLSL